MGTESRVTTFAADVGDYFGEWSLDDAGPQDNADEDDFQFLPQQAIVQHNAVALDLRDGIMIPGCLHICHNITEDFGVVLQHWWDFVQSLKHLSRFLARPC